MIEQQSINKDIETIDIETACMHAWWYEPYLKCWQSTCTVPMGGLYLNSFLTPNYWMEALIDYQGTVDIPIPYIPIHVVYK